MREIKKKHASDSYYLHFETKVDRYKVSVQGLTRPLLTAMTLISLTVVLGTRSWKFSSNLKSYQINPFF